MLTVGYWQYDVRSVRLILLLKKLRCTNEYVTDQIMFDACNEVQMFDCVPGNDAI